MLRVAIIGCGKIADNHTAQIQRTKKAEIIAVCDNELLMAKQLSDRFNIKEYYSDVQKMLKSNQLDVVHITTPPQSHYQLAKMCLESGCNIYVEKPFTLDTNEALELIDIANQKGLKITAGHNAQFTPAMIRMRELVRRGYLGGKPVHMECHYCYDFGDVKYAKALLGDKEHWVRKLPGSLLQNIISHGISKIAEYLAGDNPSVVAQYFTSTFLKQIGEDDIVDEVRVIIRDENDTTAYFTFSSQIGSAPREFRLFGPKNSLALNENNQTLIMLKNKGYKSYLTYFLPPIDFAKQYLCNFGINLKGFLTRSMLLHNDAGLRTLISRFYDAIINNGPLPLSYREIILTSRIMDEIFNNIRKSAPALQESKHGASQV